MKRIIAFALSLSFYLSQLAFAGSSLRIATYNFENFWDAHPNNTEEEWEEYKQTLSENESEKLKSSLQYDSHSHKYSNWYSPRVLQKKIEAVIEVLQLANTPDIVAIQEVESANNKSLVFQTPYKNGETFATKLEEIGYKYIYIGMQDVNNPVSVTTAFISKVELEVLDSIKIESESHNGSARDLQVVALNLPEERVILINNHWKSKRSGSEEIRIETAKILRNRVDQERKNPIKTHVVVLGDLNSAYHEKPLDTLGVSEDKFFLKANQKSPLFYNLWYDLEEKDRWETSFNGVRGTLSHILLSSSLLSENNFHYVDNSFEVLGHKGKAKEKLLSVSGSPLRWQIQLHYNWFQHSEHGFSDHLPLVANFAYKSSAKRKFSNQPRKFTQKTRVKALDSHFVNFDEIEPCHKSEAIDLSKVRLTSLENLDRKCVTLEIPLENEALNLETRGKYSHNYIKIPQYEEGRVKKYLVFGVTMVGQYDWRPNIHDKRVTRNEANILEGRFSEKNWHPKSNKCFIREVLQKKGGKLRKILGRVGYSDGFLSIHIASGQEIVLEELPTQKQKACPWY